MKSKIVGCGVLDAPQSNQITRCSHRPATRIVSLILSLAMLFSITVGIDLSVFADEYVYGDWVYTILQEPIEEKNGSAEIIGYNGSDSSVEIPSKISDGENDFDVISIGNDVFNGNSDIVVIKIPDTITNIGNSAFYKCVNLADITIPNTVINIGDYAFYGCISFENIAIPNGVAGIGAFAFSECSKLTTITMSDSVISIGNSAFDGCNINELKITDGSKTVTNTIVLPFKSTLKNVIIPNSVTSIGDSAFYDCSNLVNVIISDSVTSIGNWVFYKCSALEQIVLPNNLESIGAGAFCDCSNLIEVEIPDSVTGIDYATFWNCLKLNKIIIPDSVTGIGDNAFEYCTCLSEIEIPDSVTSIGSYAFYSCKNLTEIKIPDSVTSIGEQAFYGCSNLDDITILNKNCDIFDSEHTIQHRVTIHGYKDSSAQAYSEKYGNQFKDIEDVDDEDDNVQKLKFTDLKGFEDYNDYVMYTSVYNQFILGTNPNEYTLFSPATPVTRAMFVTILYRMAGEPYANSNPYRTSPFTDITDTSVYYYDAACWALKNGITTETTFKPFDNVNREQTASFLFRYAQKNGRLGNSAYKNVNLATYPDYSDVHGWAVDAMKWANFNGMITGTQQGYINPQGATQRIHATKILHGFGKVCNIGNFA